MQSHICWKTVLVSKERELPAVNRHAQVFPGGPLHNFGIPDEVSPNELVVVVTDNASEMYLNVASRL